MAHHVFTEDQNTMEWSMIVYGVPGGKTRFAQRIADHFGLTNFAKLNLGAYWHDQGYLYLCEHRPDLHALANSRLKSFKEVVDEMNALIPLTDWQSGPPPMVGEWNASRWRDPINRMWWHGSKWSSSYSPEQSESMRNRLAREQNNGGISNKDILWRGLSAEPIKVTE